MIYNQTLVKELESLLNSSIDPTLFPYAKGNSIRIGRYVVRSNKKGFHKVFSLDENKLIKETFCKTSAVALAKSLAKGLDCENSIVSLDREIEKQYNDCLFYKNTIKVTKDDFKKEIALTRYDIARARTLQAKSHLDQYVYA